MISIESVQGGPFTGLPSLTIDIGREDTFPSWDDLEERIARCIPPLTHITLRLTSKNVSDAEVFSFIQDAHRLSLVVSAECFQTIPAWAAAADQTILFTRNTSERQAASVIVFVTEKPPVSWRPSPVHLGHPPLLFWSSPKATLSEVLSLPTTMRLWKSFSEELSEDEDG